MSKPDIEDFKNQLAYKLGMQEHLMMVRKYLTANALNQINECSGRTMKETNDDLLMLTFQEINGLCMVILKMFSKEEIGDFYDVLVDIMKDLNNNSVNNATIHQTDGKVH